VAWLLWGCMHGGSVGVDKGLSRGGASRARRLSRSCSDTLYEWRCIASFKEGKRPCGCSKSYLSNEQLYLIAQDSCLAKISAADTPNILYSPVRFACASKKHRERDLYVTWSDREREWVMWDRAKNGRKESKRLSLGYRMYQAPPPPPDRALDRPGLLQGPRRGWRPRGEVCEAPSVRLPGPLFSVECGMPISLSCALAAHAC